METLSKMISWMPRLLDGAKITVLLTLCSVCAGLLIGSFLALASICKIKILKRFAAVYIFFFRGTPLLMQLYFIYYGLPNISRSLTINNQFLAAFIAFSLNSGAYCSEIIRSAIESIDKGQWEAAKVLGLNYTQTITLVIFPQSVRRLVPPVGNEVITLAKDASIVSLIALADITRVTRNIQSTTASSLVYIPAMMIYLAITAVFTVIFNKIEKKHAKYE